MTFFSFEITFQDFMAVYRWQIKQMIIFAVFSSDSKVIFQRHEPTKAQVRGELMAMI